MITMNGTIKRQNWDFDYITCSQEILFEKLQTSLKGLQEREVKKRLEEYGFNEPARKKKRTILLQVFSKFLNPLVIVLLIQREFPACEGGGESKEP